MLWQAVRTSRPSPSNGENITVFLIPFPTEVRLKYKNFDGTSYLRQLTPTPPMKAHIRLFPTINHCFELVGEGLPFAILKAIQHSVYPSPTLNQYYTHHLQQPRLLLQDLRLQIQHPEGNGLLSHRYSFLFLTFSPRLFNLLVLIYLSIQCFYCLSHIHVAFDNHQFQLFVSNFGYDR